MAPLKTSHAVAVCSAGEHIFVGGLSGSVIAFDGSTWTPHSTAVHQHLRGLAAASPDHVIAVGLEGKILRFDGDSWTEMDTPTNAHLEAVWLDDAGYGFAVGYGGTVLAYNGQRWSRVPGAGTAKKICVPLARGHRQTERPPRQSPASRAIVNAKLSEHGKPGTERNLSEEPPLASSRTFAIASTC